MEKKYAVARAIEIAGWVFGLSAAAIADYFIIPKMINTAGGKLLSLGVGLVLGIIVMFIFVETTRRLAGILEHHEERVAPAKPKLPKTPFEQMPLGSRILMVVLVLLVTLAMMSGGRPLPF